jgi:hypothetical protein
MFEGVYHQTGIFLESINLGWILVNDENDSTCSDTLNTLRKNGLADGIIEFSCGEEITRMYPMINGPLERLKGYYNPSSVCFLPCR